MKFKFTHSGLLLAFMLAGVLVMQSCAKETLVGGATEATDGMAEISFVARVPSGATMTTRAPETGTLDENRIDTLNILVFKTTGELVYKGAARDLAFSGTYKELVAFKATLPVGQPYDFMLLANAAHLLSGISVGATPAVVKSDVEAIVESFTVGNSDSGQWLLFLAAIPMWGEIEGLTLPAASDVVFYLHRMLARVNVEYAPPANGLDNFHLATVRYYNYNTSGYLVPDAANNMAGAYDARYATAPTIPAAPGTRLGWYVSYNGVTNYKTLKNRIYVFEAANQGEYDDGNDNWIDNPCLVVGGQYDSDNDGEYTEEPQTWYRIDFIKKTTTSEQWLSMLRNFSYNVKITSVTGDGYDDPDVALESAPMNMEAVVLDWNDAQMGDVVFDGPYFLYIGDSRNEGLRKAASVYRNVDSTDEMAFETNIPLDEFTMAIASGNFGSWVEEPTAEETDAGMVAKIFNPFYSVYIIGPTEEENAEENGGVIRGKFLFTAMKNYEVSDPTPEAILTVTSGRIRYDITINQRNADPQDWNDGGNQEEELD